MKIDKEKYPILELLENGKIGQLSLYEYDRFLLNKDVGLFIGDIFKKHCSSFRKNIKFITSTLEQSILLAKDKLMRQDLIMDIGSSTGCILIGSFTFLFDIKSEPGSDKWDCVFFVFSKKVLMCCHVENDYTRSIFGTCMRFGTLSNQRDLIPSQNNINEQISKSNESANQQLSSIILLINFLKHAETEIKYLKPREVLYNDQTCIYNNKSNSEVQIIDSLWLNTIVRSDGFMVRGHFRLQPYGEGMKDKKLIWINDFKKDGYTRIAGKLKQV